jgi:hypothetical protein
MVVFGRESEVEGGMGLSRVAQLRRRWRGLTEVGAAYYRQGDAATLSDIVDAMGTVESEITQARAAAQAATAERMADPDREPATVPEDAPAGWTNAPESWTGDPKDPVHARMSPALLRRIAQADAAEAVEAARAERARAEEHQARQEEAVISRWREDVALGLADIGDLRRYQAETAGRTPAEALADFHARQDAEDARARAAAARYGERVLAAFGPDGDQALTELLEGDSRPAGRRLGREAGVA